MDGTLTHITTLELCKLEWSLILKLVFETSMFGSLQSYSYLLYSTKKKYCGRIGSTPSPNGVVHVQMGLVQLLLFSICFTPPSIYKAKYFL